jgi:predicted DsbA family dithiol-disulfide isomerase
MTMTHQNRPDAAIQIDIVSDVMCPWCIVGFRQLEQALAATQNEAFIRWHPFELNPAMPPEGQNLREHIMEKYGASPAQTVENREQLQQIGSALDIDFNFTDDSRIVNTFAAHQLLDWAQEFDKQHTLKLALFDAHFKAGRDISLHEVLADVAETAGLDRGAAEQVLANASHAEATRARQKFWTDRGVSGVPAMVFDGKYLLTGAQGAETYAQMLHKLVQERETAQA